MLEFVAFALAALTPPLPMIAPPGCRVEATASHLVVKSQGKEARYELTSEELPFAPGDAKPRVTVLPLPGSKDTLLAALREPWEGVAASGLGRLYEVTCGKTPAIAVAMVAPGIDFGRVAIARDGRWIVGGWGGLRVLDPHQRRLTPLTNPPGFPAPGCWSAEEGKPARAADVPIVGPDGIARSPAPPPDAPAGPLAPDEILFLRGGACGYEGELRMTRQALVLDRGIIRPLVEIATFALGDDGRLLVGDGAGLCMAQTAGSIWSSADGAGWIRIRVSPRGAPGIARLVRLDNGTWLALTAICDDAIGGDLFVSTDLAAWEEVTAFPDGSSAVRGGGVGELVLANGRVYASLGKGERAKWAESADGRAWRPSGKRVLVPVPNWLAKTLGVTAINGRLEAPGASYAWTSDGLFTRAKGPPAGPWTRLFPRPQ